MKILQLLAVLSALIMTIGLGQAEAGATACNASLLPRVFDSTSGCDKPSGADEIAKRCGIPTNVAIACLKILKDHANVYATSSVRGGVTQYCRATG